MVVDVNLERIKHIHFIGIGGIGMSGIAEVLLNKGFQVSGSDISDTNITRRLQKLGAQIFQEHESKNIQQADLVVVSSSIVSENPELMAAKQARIPIIPRAQMLAQLMLFHYGVAIAGTHGKTTTTSLVASCLAEGGLDPTFVIGGLLHSAGSNARLGKSEYFVVEADESDASFLFLQPRVAVVTNIDADHLSTYGGDFNRLKQTFLAFLHHLPFNGLAIVCYDDPVMRELVSEINRPTITYGFNDEADLQILDFRQEGVQTFFTVHWRNSERKLSITLNLPGRHNALNAAAAIAIAAELGISENAICTALQQFQGVGRRFQIYGEFKTKQGSVMLVDDYGHHPREIAVTLEALRNAWPKRRLVLAFQPHRYTRTQELMMDFAKVLSSVDVLLLLQIYPASEPVIPGITGQKLCEVIAEQSMLRPVFVESVDHLFTTLGDVLQEGDVLLIQGAGSIGKMAPQLAAEWKS